MSTFQSIHIHLQKTVWALIYSDEKEAYLFLSTPPSLLLPHQALTVCQHKATGKDLQPRNTLSTSRRGQERDETKSPKGKNMCVWILLILSSSLPKSFVRVPKAFGPATFHRSDVESNCGCAYGTVPPAAGSSTSSSSSTGEERSYAASGNGRHTKVLWRWVALLSLL